MSINGLGASPSQSSVGSNSKDVEQAIQKLEQKKVKLEQDKAKADSPFSTAPSKEADEIDKKIQAIDKQIQTLKAKLTKSAGGQERQKAVKDNKKTADKNQFDKLVRSNKEPDSDEKSISGVYNVKSDEDGSQVIALTPFSLEKKDTD